MKTNTTYIYMPQVCIYISAENGQCNLEGQNVVHGLVAPFLGVHNNNSNYLLFYFSCQKLVCSSLVS